MNTKLLNKEELEWSAVVANNSMNRKRNVLGMNSYEKDIYFNPIDFLLGRKGQGEISWLDLCCGEGKALIQSAALFEAKGGAARVNLEGIDLVDFFAASSLPSTVTLKTQNLEDWTPTKNYDLITIVHGLHYVGDKIALIKKSIAALKEDGLMIGNIALENIIILNQDNPKKIVKDLFKQNEIEFNSRRKLLIKKGRGVFASDLCYVGADDKAGVNYTGQAVVNSFYTIN